MTKRELFGKCLKALVTLEYQNDPRWESTIGGKSTGNVAFHYCMNKHIPDEIVETMDPEDYALQYYMYKHIPDEIIETGDPEDYVDDFWEWVTPSEK